MGGGMTDLDNLVQRLMHHANTSKSARVQSKCKEALSKLKTARTLIEQAKLSNDWCEREAGIARAEHCLEN